MPDNANVQVSLRRRLVKGMRLVLATLLGLTALAGATEWHLRNAAATKALAQPRYSALSAAHAPFSVKHFHPSFGFFFLSENQRGKAFGNGVVSISRLGFRGPGPEAAGRRKLAFLVGNSVVFGFAPHDSLTIAGFLNRAQDRYFFVNAGAPSWASRQMRDRVVEELLSYRPALVVFWGGHNDASLALSTTTRGGSFEPGLIEAPTLSVSGSRRVIGRFAPHAAALLESLFSRAAVTQRQPVDLNVASAAARTFVDNVQAAYKASSAAGADFISVYQPILHHHRHRPFGSVSEEQREFFDRFRDGVLSQAERDSIPMLDLGGLFDSRFIEIPLFHPGTGPDLVNQVFVDAVHLYVPGNDLVARALVDWLDPGAEGAAY